MNPSIQRVLGLTLLALLVGCSSKTNSENGDGGSTFACNSAMLASEAGVVTCGEAGPPCVNVPNIAPPIEQTNSTATLPAATGGDAGLSAGTYNLTSDVIYLATSTGPNGTCEQLTLQSASVPDASNTYAFNTYQATNTNGNLLPAQLHSGTLVLEPSNSTYSYTQNWPSDPNGLAVVSGFYSLSNNTIILYQTSINGGGGEGMTFVLSQ